MSETPTPATTPEVSGTFPGWSSVATKLLKDRGVLSVADLDAFLNPSYEEHLHDPFLMSDMAAACALVKEAVDKQELIAVFSDYDCDGIPGAVVMNDFFSAINYPKTLHYIPHRHYEGFGLSVSAVEKLHADGVKLLITIDCGVTDVVAVARAKELGFTVIVTDHHEPPAELPPADAILNPKLGTYPFPDLCGAGVIFKFVTALLSAGTYAVPTGREKWWLDMVGIATIADMVPLVDENRVFAHYGLLVLRKSRRPGLQQLLKVAKANQSYLTEDDIGFTIGPRINAASRMDAPESAFQLLIAKTDTEASQHVATLETLNTARKSAVAQITKELHQWVKHLDHVPEVLVFGNPDWRPSLVGLAAAKLAEEYQRPVFLYGRDGNDIHKGSCRSGGGVSVLSLMRGARDIFKEHGGHHFSGGFALYDHAVFAFSETLNATYHELKDAARIETTLMPDAEIELKDVFGSLPKELSKIAPFGVGNPKPLFSFAGVMPQTVAQFGKGNEHTKLQFTVASRTLEAIAFFATPTTFTKQPKALQPCTLLAHIETSYFMGRHQLRLRIVDIV
jgi:single-stranded-DNA-specific exonuclease